MQVKIMKNPELLHTASEQFLGKKEHEIKSTVLQTLEGHLRAILGTLTVEEVNIYIISTLSTHLHNIYTVDNIHVCAGVQGPGPVRLAGAGGGCP